jgi:hypothetical protein
MSRFVLALDQGTTSSRSILFDRDGNIVALAQREFTQFFPQPGWVEHDANEIWVSQAVTIAEVLARAEASPRDIAAVGITNQRETVVLWDRHAGTRSPRRSCGRTGARRSAATRCAPRATRSSSRAHRPAARPVLLGHQAGLAARPRARAHARGPSGRAVLRHHRQLARLEAHRGREHVTDVTNASRTLLLNLHAGEWDDAMLDLFGVPAACLPRVLPSRSTSTRVTGLWPASRARVPLAGIAGDQQAALFGQTCFLPGMAKNTYGTGCFMLMNTGDAAAALAQPAADHRRLGLRRAPLRARRQRLRRRRGRAVAARRPRHHRALRRRRGAGRERAGQRRRAPGAGVHRASAARTGTPTRAAPSSACRAAPRAATSRAPRWKPSPSRAPNCSRRCRRDAGVRWPSCGWTAAPRQRPADAVPGRPARRAGGAPAVTETTALGAAYLAGLATGLLVVGRGAVGALAGGSQLRAGDQPRPRPASGRAR